MTAPSKRGPRRLAAKRSFTKKLFDLFLFCHHAALLEIGLAAAATVESLGHGLYLLPQVALPGHQAESVAIGVVAGEYSGSAAAGVGDLVRQFPHQNAVQTLFKMNGVAAISIARGDAYKKFPLEGGELLLGFFQRLVHPLGGGAGFLDLGGEGLGYQLVLLVGLVHQRQRPLAAGHFHSGAAPEAHGGEELDDADFAGGSHMGAAAGAAVEARHFHDPHRPGQGLFGAVEYLGQLLGGGVPAADGKILPNGLIGFPFDVVKAAVCAAKKTAKTIVTSPTQTYFLFTLAQNKLKHYKTAYLNFLVP